MNGRMSGDAVTDAGQIRDADAEIAVRAARQRFVEQARFEEHAQPASKVAGLDAGIACQMERRAGSVRDRRIGRKAGCRVRHSGLLASRSPREGREFGL